MTTFPAPSPVPALPADRMDRTDRSDSAQPAAAVPPDLGSRAVTATAAGPELRHDPGPPKLPAPIKGLGIPPLNTRQVGDFDKLDDPPAPIGVDLSDRLADLEAKPPAGVDLRR